MTIIAKIVFILLAIFLGWRLYHYIKTNPAIFSKHNISKSIFTLGILALMLIGFIAILVLIVK